MAAHTRVLWLLGRKCRAPATHKPLPLDIATSIPGLLHFQHGRGACKLRSSNLAAHMARWRGASGTSTAHELQDSLHISLMPSDVLLLAFRDILLAER